MNASPRTAHATSLQMFRFAEALGGDDRTAQREKGRRRFPASGSLLRTVQRGWCAQPPHSQAKRQVQVDIVGGFVLLAPRLHGSLARPTSPCRVAVAFTVSTGTDIVITSYIHGKVVVGQRRG